jgi:hypothetical protein
VGKRCCLAGVFRRTRTRSERNKKFENKKGNVEYFHSWETFLVFHKFPSPLRLSVAGKCALIARNLGTMNLLIKRD